mgnify:CR=1 FL=1
MDKKKRSVSEKRDRMLGFVTAMPAMILLFIFTVYPVFYLIYYSMFSGSLISAKKTSWDWTTTKNCLVQKHSGWYL